MLILEDDPLFIIREKQLEYCYGLNIVSPQKTYVEALTPNVMVLGGRAFG